MSIGEFSRVASMDELPRGASLCVEIDGREILLCHTADGVFAVDNLCSHAQARLCEGKLKGQKILCPLHGGFRTELAHLADIDYFDWLNL